MKRFRNSVYICLFVVLTFSLQQCGSDRSQEVQPLTKEITSPTGVHIILISGGWFMMGDAKGNPDESPVHKVWVSGFAMDKTEVTQDPFEQLMMAAPSHFKGSNNPVEQVRWSDAALFCSARSKQDGLEPCYNEVTFECNFEASGYRLPTEAEWEYACRAGQETAYDFGNDPQKLPLYAWYADNAQKKTQRVGTKKPNGWGLLDMYGNVSEWCNDRYDENYYKSSPERDPCGPAQGEKRVLRGGAWNSTATTCRAAYRMSDIPGITDACFARDSYGFRCVRRLTPEELKTVNQAPK